MDSSSSHLVCYAAMGLSMKRHIVILLITFGAAQAFAAEYPSRPIRIVTPFQPGGGLDVVARMLASDLGSALGQQIVVDNRSGATGTIRHRGREVARRTATRLIATSGLSNHQLGYDRNLPSIRQDFTAIRCFLGDGSRRAAASAVKTFRI